MTKDEMVRLNGVPTMEHNGMDHDLVLTFHDRYTEPGTGQKIAEWRIQPKDILEVIAKLTATASYALSAVGIAMAVGDCPTCGNRRLVTEQKNGREIAVNCPDCRGRYDRAVAFEDFPVLRAAGSAMSEYPSAVGAEAVERAKGVLAALGYVSIKAKSYRAAQERQRIAEAMMEMAQKDAASSRQWARNCLDEERRLQDRLTFVYGVARAHGVAIEELAGSTMFDRTVEKDE